ncbi:mannonate dehydratase [Parahaliea maris]|uniref:Mannonate dehydratase n=1 Tax=Parahaliea maris TaxID=2716870 RepID=A0A5C8ZP24_9GAMM|nr:mannonate dehydratase [Parahaliea maris]TXS90266.1 mannonate dehydratase [Parahaliea maris]
MKSTWRWFGPDDPVSLEKIVQAGATGIVSSLHHIATGEAWPRTEILKRKQEIEAAGLEWSVVESVPLSNDLKKMTGDWQRHLENYKESVRNLADAGICVVCYNFMPVVDWTRTNLLYKLKNQSHALRFDLSDFAAYDVFILERTNADQDYPEAVLDRARERIAAMGPEQREALERNIIAGLPGGEGSYDRDSIRQEIEAFIALGVEGFRDNLFHFLREVIPVAESVGVRMCIHPDDPPFSLFGLPRIVSTAEDARKLLAEVPSTSNGLTLCAGSFGARGDNDLEGMVREFGPHIHFVHLRNVTREADGSFYEAEHLGGDNDMVGLIRALLDEERDRSSAGRPDAHIPMRPDHGHLMADEFGQEGTNPGYSYVGRLKGLAELHGVLHTLTVLRQS